MLEGQVAALSSGLLAPDEALGVVEALFASALYREDQRSFLLYPDRGLPGFLQRNVIDEAPLAAVPLLGDLLAAGDARVVVRDADGLARFQASLVNADALDTALDDLGRDAAWAGAVARDRRAVHDVFEQVFQHDAYTGRSGVMYGYEGLGCIYWHMVAKLLVAVQEQALAADRGDVAPDVRRGLARQYFRIRAGIGYEKTAAEYGAFPTDPYSHTPPSGGAKQPGMTGQVKEEILTRRGELGVSVSGGAIRFRPRLLQQDEYLEQPGVFRFDDLAGQPREVTVPAGGLAFTLCQVPVIYDRTAAIGQMRLERDDGTTTTIAGDELAPSLAREVLGRSGRIKVIRVDLAPTDRDHH
jgi:hypothetical protein